MIREVPFQTYNNIFIHRMSTDQHILSPTPGKEQVGEGWEGRVWQGELQEAGRGGCEGAGKNTDLHHLPSSTHHPGPGMREGKVAGRVGRGV